MATVEAKVTGSTITTLIAGIVLAILNGVAADSSMLGGLPPWLQFVILVSLPPVIAFLGGYVTPSRTSAVSDSFRSE